MEDKSQVLNNVEEKEDDMVGMETYAHLVKKGGVHFVKDKKNSDNINKRYIPFNCGKKYPYRSKKRGRVMQKEEEKFSYSV